MLRKSCENDQAAATTGRVVALDRARTFITLLVVIHHSVVNFTYFGNGDRMRWLGFDLVVLFNDSFFMAFMFLISGLFVHDSLARRGAAGYLRWRAWRLGVPLSISIFVLIPIAYYASFLRYHMPGTTDFNFLHYWWRMITVGPWPSGQSWFLWVLLALDIVAAAIWSMAPKFLAAFGRLIFALSKRPATAFVAFLIVSVATYLPMHLAFGDGAWFEPGHYPFPIQTSRILLYPAYFFTGVGIGVISLRTGLLAENGEIARRWAVWLGFAVLFFGAILLLIYAHHNWIADFKSSAAVVENCVWRCLRDVQRGNDIYGAGHFIAPGAFQHEAARCDAALGLRHLSPALRLHHLAAISRLRSGAPRRRQGGDRVCRHAWRELDPYRAAAEDPVRGADDLRDLISARCEASNPESRRCDDASAPPAWMGMYDQLSFSRSDPACRLESPDASCSRMPASRSE